ncbi:MAG: YHS domain-containing protein [bacterium]|nr:YHS domain-containing protein [bacterium]
MAKDPVCGMTVDEATPAAKVDYKGKSFYFCSKHCAEQFKEEPEKYVERNK